jgi:hypothetical protein
MKLLSLICVRWGAGKSLNVAGALLSIIALALICVPITVAARAGSLNPFTLTGGGLLVHRLFKFLTPGGVDSITQIAADKRDKEAKH